MCDGWHLFSFLCSSRRGQTGWEGGSFIFLCRGDPRAEGSERVAAKQEPVAQAEGREMVKSAARRCAAEMRR